MLYREFIKLVRDGDLESVRAAVEANPDLPHVHDQDGDHWEERTALHSAARHGHLDIVKFLVEGGAEVYSHPMCTYPPIFVAANPDTQAIVDYFLNEIPHKAEGTGGLGITVNLAARFGWADIVRKHIERDPLSVHYRGWIGDTPMHWASHNGYVEIVEMLLDSGAEIEADEINCYGGKPLHWASEKQPQVVKLLLERGAKVDPLNALKSSTYFGITPLGMNVLMPDDCAEVTRILIGAGADTEVKFHGKSLIEMAEEKGNAKIVEALRSL
jgi:ankyrin repeat protein